MRYSLGMNTKLGPLTKKALKAGASLWCAHIGGEHGEYFADVKLADPRFTPRLFTGRGASAEEALDDLERVLRVPAALEAAAKKLLEDVL